jgi:penicillin-binding protein-related factor A (putative recombinase)
VNETYITRQVLEAWHLREPSLYYHKVADAGGLDFSQPRAVDVLGWVNGRGFGIEFKLHKSATEAFAIAKVREDQVRELLWMRQTNGSAWLFIVQVHGRESVLYALQPHEWIALCKRAHSEKRKSIPLSWLLNYTVARHAAGTKYEFDLTFIGR